MPEPTQITTHSADVLRRLEDFLQGKPKVEALLRSKSSARIDVTSVLEGELYQITVGTCELQYTPTLGETTADIATALSDLLNSGGTSATPRESFEGFTTDEDFVGPGVHGEWFSNFNFGGAPDAFPLVVTEDEARSGVKSVRSTFASGIETVAVGFAIQNIAGVANYPGSAAAALDDFFYFRLEDGFIPPATPGEGIEGIPQLIGTADFGIGPAILFFVALGVDWAVPGTFDPTIYSIAAVVVGGSSATAGPYPISELQDGAWHKFRRAFDKAGVAVELEIDDDPARNLSSAGLGAVPVDSFGLFSGHTNLGSSTYFGAKEIFVDDLNLGVPNPCGVIDINSFVPPIVQDFDNFTPPAVVTGVSYDLTWTATPPFGTPPEYLGGLITNATEARSAPNSARSDLGGGLAIGAPGFQLFNSAWALTFPGVGSPLQRTKLWVKFPVGFPGAAFDALGASAELFCPAFGYLDTTTFVAYTLALGVVSGTTDFTLSIFDPVAVTKSFTVLIPRASLLDSAWHSLFLEVNSEDFTVVAEVDGVQKINAVIPAALGTTLAYALLAASPAAMPAGGTVVPDFFIDDLEVGGSFSRLVCAKGLKNDPDDPHFYVMRKNCGTGADLSVLTEQDDRFAINRIGPVDQLQELEDTLFNMLDQLGLDAAEGEQLDRIGTIVGLSRATGQSDDDYRALIRVQIQSNLSNGEIERLIAIVKAFTSSSIVKLTEVFPGEVNVHFDGEVVNAAELINAADGAAAGGVRLLLFENPPAPVFTFDGPPGTGFDEGAFSDIVKV
jgi:hypothetical protein